MKVSLNELVAILADRVGQPFNLALQEELKIILNYKRADFFRKLLERNPGDRKYFLKEFIAEVNPVDKAGCPSPVGGCKILETIKDIPLPIRTSYGLFDYVGTIDGIAPFGYATPEQALMYTYNRYTSTKPKYYRVNNKVTILNDNSLYYIKIRGVYPDPRVLLDFKCDGSPCYTDDDQYEIPDDIINAIMVDTLKYELRGQFPEQDEVIVDENSKAKDKDS